jgi:hypothetical protein
VGGTLEQADRTIHPTMLTDGSRMLIMQEEIFADRAARTLRT